MENFPLKPILYPKQELVSENNKAFVIKLYFSFNVLVQSFL